MNYVDWQMVDNSSQTARHGLVVYTLKDKIGLIGSGGGEPTFYSVTIPFKVGDWVEVDMRTGNVAKLEQHVETTVRDGLITIRSYVVSFDLKSPMALSPHVGTVIIPSYIYPKKSYVYEANITCYVNKPEYNQLMKDYKSAWKLDETYANMVPLEGIDTLCKVEHLYNKAGCLDQIELKPLPLDPKHLTHPPTAAVGPTSAYWNAQESGLSGQSLSSLKDQNASTSAFGEVKEQNAPSHGFGSSFSSLKEQSGATNESVASMASLMDEKMTLSGSGGFGGGSSSIADQMMSQRGLGGSTNSSGFGAGTSAPAFGNRSNGPAFGTGSNGCGFGTGSRAAPGLGGSNGSGFTAGSSGPAFGTGSNGYGFRTGSNGSGLGGSTPSFFKDEKIAAQSEYGGSTFSDQKTAQTGYGGSSFSDEKMAAQQKGFGGSSTPSQQSEQKTILPKGFSSKMGAPTTEEEAAVAKGFSPPTRSTTRFDPMEFRGGPEYKKYDPDEGKPKVEAPIVHPVEYQYLGVVISVNAADYITVYTREGGNVYVNKSRLTTTQRFDTCACNWVRLNVRPNTDPKRPQFTHEIITIKAATIADVDKEFRNVVWAKASVTDSIRIMEATLYFAEQKKNLGKGMQIQQRKQGELIVFHPFVGEVVVEDRAYHQIRAHRQEFDATVELTKDGIRTFWRVAQFVYDGTELTLNGYMSKIGHGKWQQVRDQNLPRLALQKEKNLTHKNSAPTPNAAVKGSLGWHIPAVRDPDSDTEEDKGTRGGDRFEPEANPEAYEGILLMAPSLIAGKVEFNRDLKMPEPAPKKKAHGFTKVPEEEGANYSMPPAVTTMPMKMKNEWMGCEGGWVDKAGKKYGKDKMMILKEEEERRQNSKNNDEDWFAGEHDLDDKGKKMQDGWTQVDTEGMVVKMDDGFFVLWLKEKSRVIAVRSDELFVTAWVEISFMWNEAKKLITMKSMIALDDCPDGVVPYFDEDTNETTVLCVVDFICSQEQGVDLSSPVLGKIEVHSVEAHDEIWNDTCFNKRLEIEVKFVLANTAQGDMAGNWVLKRLHSVVGSLWQEKNESEA